MKIIIATDGSQCSKKMIDFVAKRPWSKDDEFIILTVAQDQTGVMVCGVPAGTVSLPRERDNAKNIVESDLNKLKARLPENKIKGKILSGFVSGSIREYAREVDADLIVMGSHGRSGFEKFMIGSVAEEVLKKSPCSVQIVKNQPETKASEPKEEVDEMKAEYVFRG